MSNFEYDEKTNVVSIENCVNINGVIKGKNNNIKIGNTKKSYLNIFINGDNNKIQISNTLYTMKLNIFIGGIYNANNTSLIIGKNFSCGSCDVLLPNPRNTVDIGENCMFSSKITLRCGELPHLIFDLQSGEYIDTFGNILIGNHVWVGQNVYITKKCSIPSGCIVAANSCATRNFSEENSVIAGNPAQIVKKNIFWSQGIPELNKSEKYYNNFNNWYKKAME